MVNTRRHDIILRIANGHFGYQADLDVAICQRSMVLYLRENELETARTQFPMFVTLDSLEGYMHDNHDYLMYETYVRYDQWKKNPPWNLYPSQIEKLKIGFTEEESAEMERRSRKSIDGILSLLKVGLDCGAIRVPRLENR